MNPERKVGIAVVAGVAVLLGAVFVIGKVNFGMSGYALKINYRFVSGLRDDAAVRYAGGPIVGKVRKLEVADEMVTAHLWIDRGVKIREDCEFWIYTAGLLGEQYVEINASPGGKAPFVKDGATIRGIDPESFDATLIRLGKMVNALAPIFAKKEVANSIHSMVGDLSRAARKISQVVDRHAGGIDSALGNLTEFSRSLNAMTNDLKSIVANLREISDPDNPHSASKAMAKVSAALDSLQKTGLILERVAKKIDEGDGALGVLINDKQLAADIKALIKKLKDEPIRARVRLF